MGGWESRVKISLDVRTRPPASLTFVNAFVGGWGSRVEISLDVPTRSRARASSDDVDVGASHLGCSSVAPSSLDTPGQTQLSEVVERQPPRTIDKAGGDEAVACDGKIGKVEGGGADQKTGMSSEGEGAGGERYHDGDERRYLRPRYRRVYTTYSDLVFGIAM